MKMTPTNHSTITPEGLERKLQRLIARSLKKEHPFLYAQLEVAALQVIEFDNRNPFATVVGADRERPAVRKANLEKMIDRQVCIDNSFHPTHIPGKTTTMMVKDSV